MEKKMRNIGSYFNGLALLFTTPQGWIASIIVAIASYFTPVGAVVAVIFGFVIMDLITGVWAAKKRKEKIRSHTMRNSVTKLLCYLIVILLAFVLQKEIITFSWFAATNIAAGLICLAEFKSVVENMGDITGNSVFKKIFESFSDVFKKNRDKFIEGGTPPTPEEKQTIE